MWIKEQANTAGVDLDDERIAEEGWDVISSPVVHDSVGTKPSWLPYYFLPGRTVKFLRSSRSEPQPQYSGAIMTTTASRDFFDYRYLTTAVVCANPFTENCAEIENSIKGLDDEGNRTLVGMVHDSGPPSYEKWLEDHYELKVKIAIDPTRIRADNTPKAFNER